jgi:hypothetical protein
MDPAKKAKVEALLRQDLDFLSSFPIIPKRDHILEERSCKKCGFASTWVVRRCGYKLCRHCARGYRSVCREFKSKEIVPANLLHVVLPYRSVALQDLKRDNVINLQKAFVSFRRQAFFKQAVEAGHYNFEMSVSESLAVHLHIHLLIQTRQPVRTRPINIDQASSRRHEFAGRYMEAPQPLRQHTVEEADKVFAYTIKSLRGEQTVLMLRDLAGYVEMEGKYCERAKELRTFIIRRYNTVFYGVHRRGFFGAWYGKGKHTVTHAKPVANREYRCHCWSRAPLTQQ